MTTLIPKYYEGATSSVNRPINLKLGEFISVADFIPVGTVTSTTDCSTYFTAAFNAVINQGGGTLWIPYGVYKVNLDWSSQIIAGAYNPITIMGNNSTLLGVTGATAVLTINRGGTGDNFISSNLEIRDLTFTTESNVCNGGTPVIPYAVQILKSSASFYNCNFNGGSTAAYYGVNSQYAKFIDCSFQCATLYGCLIQSKYSETSADQMTFDRCIFGSTRNGLYIQGCQQLRVMNSRVQSCFAGTGAEGGIVIKDYLDSAGSEGILLLSIHFEGNQVRDVYMPSQTSRTVIQSCVFGNPIGYITGFLANVDQTSTNSTYISNDFRTASGPTVTVAGNLGQFVYIGNDKSPYSLTLSGSNPQCIIQDTTSGALDFQYSQLNVSGFYGRPGLYFPIPVSGGTYLWVSSTGVLRIKSGSAPTSDSDGVAVGSQS